MPESPPPDSAFLRVALEGVACATWVCRHVQRQLDDLRAITKDDSSPVTIADFASQAVVARALNRAGVLLGGMVAEESSAFLRQPEHAAHLEACVDALHRSDAWPLARREDVLSMIDLGAADPAVLNSEEGGWTLDPVDGTKGFLRGEQYCISLAHIRRGRVEAGVLGCPNLPQDHIDEALPSSDRGCFLLAVRGGGTWFTNGAFPGAQIMRDWRTPELSPRLAESVETSHTRHDTASQIMALAGPSREPVRIDSQCKYALLARGDADVYLRLPSKRTYVERIWDHAAGMLIAQEAGCIVTDIRGKPLDFSKGRGLEANEGILGAPPALHARLLAAIHQVLPPS